MWNLAIRFLSVILLGGYVLLRHRTIKSNRVKQRILREKDSLKNFTKDSNGFYPWEVDTNDSPKRIAENTPKFVQKERIRRGRW